MLLTCVHTEATSLTKRDELRSPAGSVRAKNLKKDQHFLLLQRGMPAGPPTELGSPMGSWPTSQVNKKTHASRTHASRTHATRTRASQTHASRTHASRTHASRALHLCGSSGCGSPGHGSPSHGSELIGIREARGNCLHTVLIGLPSARTIETQPSKKQCTALFAHMRLSCLCP